MTCSTYDEWLAEVARRLGAITGLRPTDVAGYDGESLRRLYHLGDSPSHVVNAMLVSAYPGDDAQTILGEHYNP